LIDKSSLVEIFSIELVACSSSEISDDGVGGEEGSLRGLEQRQSVEDGNGCKVRVGVVRDLLDFEFEGVDDSLDLSVSAVGGSFCAEVKFHVC
jgi:hypothetical protein